MTTLQQEERNKRFDEYFKGNIGKSSTLQVNTIYVRNFLQSEVDLAVANKEKEIVETLSNVLTIDVNPSNEDQRIWYRGLGREEAQRKMRDKVLKAITKNK